MTARPRLLFSTAPFFRQPLREAYRHGADAGFEAVEIMVTQDPATQEPHQLARLAREVGLAVPAIHAPFLLVTRRVWGTSPVGKIYRAVHLAESVGASLVVVHPPYRWQVRYRVWIEESLAEYSRATGVTVAVENMFPWRARGRELMAYLPHWDPVGQSYEHVTLDLSHTATAGADSLSPSENARPPVSAMRITRK